MTTLEIQANTTSPVRMPTLITEPQIPGVQGSRVVVDCPADAWDGSDKQAIADLRNTFGDDLVDTHETALRRAGIWLIETHLRAEWRNRDFAVTFAENTNSDTGIYAVPADEVYHQVWQAAADRISDRDLVLAADLGHVFVMSTELEMHRAVLNFRLDAIAATFDDETCEKAWQQLDGLRAAVENAKTREQLIAIGASFA